MEIALPTTTTDEDLEPLRLSGAAFDVHVSSLVCSCLDPMDHDENDDCYTRQVVTITRFNPTDGLTARYAMLKHWTSQVFRNDLLRLSLVDLTKPYR